MYSNEIYKIHGTEYKKMTKILLNASKLSKVIEIKSQKLDLDKNLRIMIKPNLVSCTPADFGATTHPEIVAGIIEYLMENDYNNISIAEGSWIGDKTSDAFEYCGFNELSRTYNIPLIDTQLEQSHSATATDIPLNICDCVKDSDFLINVPVLKGHCQTKITCALKNMKGLIPNSEKRRFHTMGLHAPIAHLNANIKQDFIVIDHICGDPDYEEGGNPLVKNCIMTSTDPVLTDTYVCSIFGYTNDDVEYVRLAKELGIGCGDINTLSIKEVSCENMDSSHYDGILTDINSVSTKNGCFEVRELSLSEDLALEKMPDTHKILNVSHMADEIDSCSACYAELMDALTRLYDEGIMDESSERICIGQGHRGKSGKLGVGNCTKNFEINIPGCPPSSDDIYEFLKAYCKKN